MSVQPLLQKRMVWACKMVKWPQTKFHWSSLTLVNIYKLLINAKLYPGSLFFYYCARVCAIYQWPSSTLDFHVIIVTSHHLIKFHSNEPNFQVYCGSITRSFAKINILQKHFYREHNVLENTCTLEPTVHVQCIQ